MKLRHPRVWGILISILFFVVLVDGCLYHLDPLGIVAGTHDNHTFHYLMQDDATGYILQAGTHPFRHLSMTILADGSRAVPATNGNAECTIATIGDSMTFGLGVADSETWVNLLAARFPDVHVINPARPDYSAPNVAALKAAYPANGYIWLLIYNDALAPYVYRAVYPAHPYPPATAIYRTWLMSRLQGHSSTPERIENMGSYWQAVEAIRGDNVFIIGFAGDELTQTTALRYPFAMIPAYTASLSAVDSHPNATGHQQITDNMYPYVAPFIEKVCHVEN